MASPKYFPIPPQEHHQPPPLLQPPIENYVVLPCYHSPSRFKISFRTLLLLIGILFLSLYSLWPSSPEIKITRLRLKHLKVHTRPRLTVDLSLATTFKVRNRDAYTLDFDGFHVAIWYRGKELGHVISREGHVPSWGSSYVNAVTEFHGVEVIHDWVHLLEDLLKGTVPFDTVSAFNGHLRLYFFEISLKEKISCGIEVNVKNQTITHQTCYPE